MLTHKPPECGRRGRLANRGYSYHALVATAIMHWSLASASASYGSYGNPTGSCSCVVLLVTKSYFTISANRSVGCCKFFTMAKHRQTEYIKCGLLLLPSRRC